MITDIRGERKTTKTPLCLNCRKMFISKEYSLLNKGEMVCLSIKVDCLYLGWIESKIGSWKKLLFTDHNLREVY